jgi:thiosulfate/3-mercaptopyruvate sulfurtransferase
MRAMTVRDASNGARARCATGHAAGRRRRPAAGRRDGMAIAIRSVPQPIRHPRSTSMSEPVLISPADLDALMKTEKVVVIDTRDPQAYAAGHLEGAVNLREIFTFLAMSTAEGLAELQQTFADAFGSIGLSGDETAVLYEESMNSGFGQSCRGYFLLSWLRYPKVRILHGGLSAWTAAGLPLTTAPAAPTPATFPLPDVPASLMVTKDEMLAALDSDVVLLDVRDVDEWIGESSSPYGKDYAPRKGRIPGAKWIEWYRFMKPSGAGQVFKSPDEILADCRSAGISPKDPVFLYCFKGARASNTYVALKEAGFSDVRMYFGSWNEWSREPGLPIETGFPAD